MNNEVKKVLFIVNKFAGTGYQPELEGRILDVCEKQEVEATIEFTQSRGHATDLAREAQSKGFSWVMAVGGDGTINEVARGLIGTSIDMGIIPRGSGNGLARHLGIPMGVAPALTSLFNSKTIPMDTFLVNGHLSLNVSGIGFDGHVANLFASHKTRGLGGYVKITLAEFFKFKERAVELVVDGKVFQRSAFIIALANSSQYGNNARIAPLASVCDQKINVTLLKKVPPYRMDFVYDFFRGNVHRSPYSETFEGQHIEIRVSDPIAYHVDGEPSGEATSFDIVIQPGSLQMLAPRTTQYY